MAILAVGDYPAIRAALDTSIDSDVLPDATIGLAIYAGAADAAVLERDPDAATRTGSELIHVTNAAIFFCAAFLVPALPDIIQESYPSGYRYNRQQIDWDDKRKYLLSRANEEIEAVLAPADETPGKPTMFTVAVGRRGR